MEQIYEFTDEMLFDVCNEVNNFFVVDRDKHHGFFSIRHGDIVPNVYFAASNYLRIFGSSKNDGVHSVDDVLTDESTFRGTVWVMHVPQDFLRLVSNIEKWQTANAAVIDSPYTSESFGGYSYTKDAKSADWRTKFKPQLDAYRKIRI